MSRSNAIHTVSPESNPRLHFTYSSPRATCPCPLNSTPDCPLPGRTISRSPSRGSHVTCALFVDRLSSDGARIAFHSSSVYAAVFVPADPCRVKLHPVCVNTLLPSTGSFFTPPTYTPLSPPTSGGTTSSSNTVKTRFPARPMFRSYCPAVATKFVYFCRLGSMTPLSSRSALKSSKRQLLFGHPQSR